MDTLVLTTLLFAGLGLIAIVVNLAVETFLPHRHKTRPWVRADKTEQHHAA